MRRRGALLVLLWAIAGPAGAQQVERVGSADVALDRRIARLLQSPGTRLVTRDTLVARGDTVDADVLVLGEASVVLEGTVTGDLVTVDGGLFIRAGSRVEGDVVNVGGGLYRSFRAQIGGRIIDLPDAPYYVEDRPGDRLVIVAREAPVRLRLDGALGFHQPRYDRVDGVSLDWGAAYDLPLVGPVQPTVHGRAGVRTERGAFGWGGDLALRWGAVTLSGGIERATRTPDAWLRTDIVNSLSYLWDGDDYRNYYEADRTFARATYELGDERKQFHAVLGVAGQIEEGRSLSGGAPWTLLNDPVRPNPAIDDGRLVSGSGILRVEWTGLTTVLRAGLRVEAGRTVADGDFEFDRYEAWGTWAIAGILDHTLEVDWRVQGPLPGTDSLPRQRWTTVGGITTLQTYPVAHFRGDRAAFVETDYVIPFPEWLALPLLGAPDLHLTHAAARAWTADAPDARLEQNVGAMLEFLGVYVRYMQDPSGTTDDSLLLGVYWPFGQGYPWES